MAFINFIKMIALVAVTLTFNAFGKNEQNTSDKNNTKIASEAKSPPPQFWEKGMEYAYYGGDCTPSDKQKCMTVAQYKMACQKALGVSSYAMQVRAVNAFGEEKILLEAGVSVDTRIFWGRNNIGEEGCAVNVTRAGIVNGNSARRVISGKATNFIFTTDGKILVTQFNNY